MAEKRDEDTAALMAGMATAGAAAGGLGYLGSKAMIGDDPPIVDPMDESPFIERPKPEVPDVEGGFGSPEQRRAASEASAGARGVRKAVNPYSLYVPEFAPGGQRQPLDVEGGSRFRDYMKTPGMSNPNKGKLFDYVPEGTVSLLEEEARLQRYAEQTRRALDSGMLSLSERVQAQAALSDADGRISAIRGVVMEIDADPGELAMSQFKRYEVPQARQATNMTRFDLDKEYRKMAADEFTSKIEKGLDNARRYLDQSEIARELMTKRPKVPASVGRTAKMAAGVLGIVPEPTDLALLALAGPAEMMFGTGIGEEPETGTFGIPLETTLQNASRIIDQPLDSRHINVDTRIRLADQDYAMASQLHSDGVLSREAFDIITRIRRARGGDTTVMPLARPEVPDTEPAIGLPGRRL
tara:strand:- start:977 stop:2212 length:1236 start_codon:yes stop_codon:yes gene_type:complete